MKKAFEAYQAGKITRAEMYRYQTLHSKLIGKSSFVMIGDTPLWDEFGALTRKIEGLTPDKQKALIEYHKNRVEKVKISFPISKDQLPSENERNQGYVDNALDRLYAAEKGVDY